MKYVHQFLVIMIGINKYNTSVKDVTRHIKNGFITYMAFSMMMSILGLVLAIMSIMNLSLSNTMDEMELVKVHYDAERGTRWFVAYCKSGHVWDRTNILEVERTKDCHVYIKSDAVQSNPQHIMCYAIRHSCTARVHIYIKEKEDHTLEVVYIKPY